MTVPRPEHPRPDRRRARWATLNGPWEFSFDEPTFGRSIVVPFAHQCAASGIGDTEHHETMWYRRRFVPPGHAGEERVLLHFGAVDFEAEVWVDGTRVGAHRGGHTSFTFDVTDALVRTDEEHEVVVRAVDEYRSDQLRGKQTATFPYMVHYTATSGIWQPVWVEVTGSAWLHELHVVAGADGSLEVSGDVRGEGATTLHVVVDVDGREVVVDGDATAAVTGRVDGAHPWSPHTPSLYDLRAELRGSDGSVLDEVHGHVGFRTITIDGDRWMLNDEPLHQRLLLDQGYWPESLLTPPSDEAIATDLRFVKDAGFDGVRKHQKIEDPRWLWHADRMGVLVWEELPSPFGVARVSGRLADELSTEWADAIRRDRSHPSIVAWVPFNESWGIQGVHHRVEHQRTVRRVVAETRALDGTRPVIDNSGWGHVDTDVVDVHDYDQDPDSLARRWSNIEARRWERTPLELEAAAQGFDLVRWLAFAQVDTTETDPELLREMIPDLDVWADGCMPPSGQAGPLVISEMGGVGLAVDGETAERFDYAAAADADDLLERFAALVHAVESIPDVRGWCWTQLTDVEQEINGLLTADRRPKVDPSALRLVLEHGATARTGSIDDRR